MGSFAPHDHKPGLNYSFGLSQECDLFTVRHFPGGAAEIIPTAQASWPSSPPQRRPGIAQGVLSLAPPCPAAAQENLRDLHALAPALARWTGRRLVTNRRRTMLVRLASLPG